MSKYWFAPIIIILIFSGCNIQNKKFNWKEFVSDEGRFKVMFPDIPKTSVEENDWKDVSISTYKFEVFSQIYFSVRYSDYRNSSDGLDKDKLKYLYDYQRDFALKVDKSELISEKDIWVGENLGREIVVSRKTFFNLFKAINTYRFYSIEGRTFQLNASTQTFNYDIKAIKDINRFFDSFEYIEKSL